VGVFLKVFFTAEERDEIGFDGFDLAALEPYSHSMIV
jgi:hypothetical protein